MRMTGATAKSTRSNAGNGKALSGAWPNHDFGCQTDRLGGTTRQCAASKASQTKKRLGEPLLVRLPCQMAIQMGNAGSENFVFGKGVSNYVLRSNPQLPGRRFGIAKSVKKGQPVDYEPLQNGVFLYDRPTLTVKPIRFIGKVSTTCAVLTAVAPELTADC